MPLNSMAKKRRLKAAAMALLRQRGTRPCACEAEFLFRQGPQERPLALGEWAFQPMSLGFSSEQDPECSPNRALPPSAAPQPPASSPKARQQRDERLAGGASMLPITALGSAAADVDVGEAQRLVRIRAVLVEA